MARLGSCPSLALGDRGRRGPRDGSGPAVADAGAEAVRKARDCHFGSLEEDAALLAQLWDVNEEHEHTLRRWEDDLARREEALRQQLRRERPVRDRHMDAAWAGTGAWGRLSAA